MSLDKLLAEAERYTVGRDPAWQVAVRWAFIRDIAAALRNAPDEGLFDEQVRTIERLERELRERQPAVCSCGDHCQSEGARCGVCVADLERELAEAREQEDRLDHDLLLMMKERNEAAAERDRLQEQTVADGKKLDALIDERDRLRAALLNFGEHDDDCPFVLRHDGSVEPCECGLAHALDGGEG